MIALATRALAVRILNESSALAPHLQFLPMNGILALATALTEFVREIVDRSGSTVTRARIPLPLPLC